MVLAAFAEHKNQSILTKTFFTNGVSGYR